MAIVNMALSRKAARDGLSAEQSKFGAALYSMTVWLQASLFANPKAAANLISGLDNFIQSFAQASSASGQTQTMAAMYLNLKESRWLTEEEIAPLEYFEELRTPAPVGDYSI